MRIKSDRLRFWLVSPFALVWFYASCLHSVQSIQSDGSKGIRGVGITFQPSGVPLGMLVAFCLGPCLFALFSPLDMLSSFYRWYRFVRAYVVFLFAGPLILTISFLQRGQIIAQGLTLLLILFAPELGFAIFRRYTSTRYGGAQLIPRDKFSYLTRLTISASAGIGLLIGLPFYFEYMLQSFFGTDWVPPGPPWETLSLLGVMLTVLVGAYLPARILYGIMKWKLADDGLRRCPKCYYILTGNVSGVCPECGMSLSDVALTPSSSGSSGA